VPIKSSLEDSIVIIEVKGKLMGGRELSDFSSEIDKYLNQGFNKLIIDLEKVDWIGSSGLSVLLQTDMILRKRESRLVLAGLSKKVALALAATKLTVVFDIFNTREEAINFLKKKNNL
jgi:anti-sigma B factor antagonist